ncbi:hypothetical protein FLK61_31955 [Paenalkalicoccus suaedae]|uniref:Uncharacterized protein n=1 Tax=Paenalkalicoccus suaedae TaxID=2592382 RepID=A0A859FFE9_9BACI|nr:hypothetical protein [Paenalkalicoccus suaedae]QKS71324.1 hypothetical protein FLK61_31955 [Paenalkalicoccus suaedae]
MKKEAIIYNSHEATARDLQRKKYGHTDLLHISGALKKGQLRISPTALNRVCEQYDKLTLLTPLSTGDELQQGNHVIREAFLLELFTYYADKNACKLTIKRQASIKQVKDTKKSVTSVQAWQEASDVHPDELAASYFRFLPLFTKKLIRVRNLEEQIEFQLAFLRLPLLTLRREKHHDDACFSSYVISGGLLTNRKQRTLGRLWFMRSNQKEGMVYTAITHYKPSLPWWMYRFTQATLHKMVMWQFKRYRS